MEKRAKRNGERIMGTTKKTWITFLRLLSKMLPAFFYFYNSKQQLKKHKF